MNNKGFVLVESIVTSVFVLGLFTFIIANILPLIAGYDKEVYYDSIDSIYDAHLIRKMILMDEACNVESILSFGSTDLSTKGIPPTSFPSVS